MQRDLDQLTVLKKLRKMKTINYTQENKTELLSFIDPYWEQDDKYISLMGNDLLPKSLRYSKKEVEILKKEYVNTEFAKIKDVENYYHALYQTEVFDNEAEMIDHSYATATGSNYDLCLFKFRNEKYVVDSRNVENLAVEIYNGENFE